MRCESILSEIYNTFDKSKLDPILLTFKSSEMLHEFYHKRIFELITASLQNEQEKTIQALLAENKQLSSINSELKQKIGQIQTCYQSLKKENSETLTNIATIENEIKLKNDENEKLNLLISQLQNQNEGFQHQVLQLQNENSKLTDKLNELANITILKDNEIKDKNEQINYFKENITHIKEKQNEMTKSLEGMIQQNYDLKNELDTKNNDLNELVKKIESLKLDFQAKGEEINKEVQRLRDENENILKVKIQALKNKLREKIAIINKLNEEHNYISPHQNIS